MRVGETSSVSFSAIRRVSYSSISPTAPRLYPNLGGSFGQTLKRGCPVFNGGRNRVGCMGRFLVNAFLVSALFAIITTVVALADLVYSLGLWAASSVDPPLVNVQSGWDGALLTVAVIYFFVAVPLLATSAILWDRSQSRRRAPAPVPARATCRGQEVVVVLTAYDDEDSIGPAVDEFRGVSSVSQVVVVDNNSKDSTSAVAAAHGAVVVREERQGYGFACMGGLQYVLDHSPAEIIALCEGDMTFFAADLEKMLPYLSDCDLVLGSRTTRTLTRAGSQMDWFMTWGNLFLAFLIRLRYWDTTFVGRAGLTDVGCTYRVIRRDALARIMSQLTVGGHYFSPHMILVSLRNGLSIVEIPVRFRERVGLSKGAGGSRSRAVRIGFEMIREIALH